MLRITTYPDPILRRIADPVDTINDDILSLIDDMEMIMYTDDGVGLAAPQVSVSKQIIVTDAGEGLFHLINPEITFQSDAKETMDEGCLSLPEVRVPIERSLNIKVTGLNRNGQIIEREIDGLLARVVQHEIDHLNGILIIDRASSVHRSLMRSRLKKLEKQFG